MCSETTSSCCSSMACCLRRLVVWVVLLLSVGSTMAQRTVRGRVTDAATGEKMPFVNVVFAGTSQGTVTDMEGRFKATCPDSIKVLEFRMVGYATVRQKLTPGNNNLKVEMRSTAEKLQEVSITAKRGGTRYKRKDNPALALAKEVIAHKAQNHIESVPQFSRRCYTKNNAAFDDFHPDFQHHFFWRNLDFIEKYIDVTEFDYSEILTISVTEEMKQQQFRRPPGQLRTLVTAGRTDGIERKIQQEGGSISVSQLFATVDIYQNDIELLENHFVSPLHDVMASAVYHYFITDTVEIDGVTCVELSFAPANRQSFAFMGRMYVVCDSSYAVKQFDMTIPRNANINFVRGINLKQTYQRDSSGHYLPERGDVYGRLGLFGRKEKTHRLFKQLYVHNLELTYDYSFADTLPPFPDSLFSASKSHVTLPEAYRVRRKTLNKMRPIELSYPELMLDSFRYELMRKPAIHATFDVVEALATGYIATSRDRDSSRFNIGSLYNFYSVNAIEGTRLRLGGTTTAQLDRRNFASGYVAYGTLDKHFKFNLELIRTFADRRRKAYESPQGSVSLLASHDIESPGLSTGMFDRDNILMTSTSRLMEYVTMGQVQLLKQWKSNLSLSSKLMVQHHAPIGELTYWRLSAEGSPEKVDAYNNTEWHNRLTYVPRQKRANVSTQSPLINTNSSPLSVAIEHNAGYMEGFFYNRTSLIADKILWVAPFGYFKFHLLAGKVWGQAPLPKLFFPNANPYTYMVPNSFYTMDPMEFVVDQHVSFFANYHAKGLILNHVPLIRRLRLREVASFNLLWGSLSAKNDPAMGHAGLFLLPETTARLGQVPFMEYSVGVENILGLIRVDYVRRITYLSGAHNNGFRISMEISL